MASCRLFLSQDALDRWISESRAVIEGDELTDKQTGQKFRVLTGVRFVEEVSGQPDAANLVGKVKDVDQLAQLHAEHLHDSVVLGENAYVVQEGFIGVPLLEESAAVAEPAKVRPRAATIASLQAFFLNNVK